MWLFLTFNNLLIEFTKYRLFWTVKLYTFYQLHLVCLRLTNRPRLLMMGKMLPETCWALFTRVNNKRFYNWACICLVVLFEFKIQIFCHYTRYDRYSDTIILELDFDVIKIVLCFYPNGQTASTNTDTTICVLLYADNSKILSTSGDRNQNFYLPIPIT
jgi:hypothetical protein